MTAERAASLKRYWPLAILLVFAFLVRLPSPTGASTGQMSEFQRDIQVTRDMDAGYFPLAGPPCTYCAYHYRFGPIFYYWSYPFAKLLHFGPNSLAPVSLIFSLAGIAMMFFVVRRWFRDARFAYLAAFIVAVSALDIDYAKFGSNPNPVPFFVLLFFFALEKFVRRAEKPADAALAGLAFGVAVQLHAIPMFCLPIIIAWLLLAKKIRPSAKNAAVFLTVALLLNAPYLYFEVSQGFFNLRSVIGIAAGSAAGANLTARLAETAEFWLALWVRLGELFRSGQGIGYAGLAAAYVQLVLLAVVWRYERRRLKPAAWTVRLPASVRTLVWPWLLVPSALLAAPFTSMNAVHPFYFLMIMPLAYLLLALGLVRLLEKGWRLTAGCLFASYVGWQAFQIIVYHMTMPSVLTAWIA